MSIIDFHTHAFPDALAARAVPLLEAEADVKAVLDGTIGSLLGSMDAAGIDVSVVLSIATKPGQFDAIMAWSETIRSTRLIPFPSVHPDDPDALEHIDQVAQAGFKGLKIHPYYQDFVLGEQRMQPYYDRCRRNGLILLCHTGYDIAFPRDARAGPRQILQVVDRFPDLLFVTSHLCAWDDWEEACRLLIGKPVYTDLSYAVPFFKDRDTFRQMVLAHPATHLLFGSDSPWGGQMETMQQIRQLNLSQSFESAILGGNAHSLLGHSD